MEVAKEKYDWNISGSILETKHLVVIISESDGT